MRTQDGRVDRGVFVYSLALVAASGCSGGSGAGSAPTAGSGAPGGGGRGGSGSVSVGGAGSAGSADPTGGVGGTESGSGAAGGTTDGGAGAAGAGPLDECPGTSFAQDGVLDLDLRAVSVSGNVTLNGGALPALGGDRGQIVFGDLRGVGTATVALGAAGAGRYELRLPPGDYRIRYVANGATCAGASATGMPCNDGELLELTIAADGVLDIDIPVAAVSGRVTLDGAPMPDQTSDRGALAFVDVEGGRATTESFGTTGPATYAIHLLPGFYDVQLAANADACAAGDMPPAVPCVGGNLLRAVTVSAGVLDVDVTAVRVTGAVTVNGMALPQEAVERGSLAFSAADGGATASTRSLGVSGPATYAMTLVPGVYDVAFEANASLCAPDRAPSVPCVGGRVLSAMSLTADGVLDVDVAAVTVSGSVTLLGAPLPDAEGDRGTLELKNATAGSGSVALDRTGGVSYRVRVIAGSYDVDFVANPELCAGSIAPELPCTGGNLARGIDLRTDGVFDADLQRVRVAGAVTVRGSQLPDATAGRGAVRFVNDAGAATAAAPFAATGPARYEVTLWPGTYEAHLDANAALCGPGLAAPPVPCVGGLLRADTALMSDGVLDLDLAPVRVSGSLTVNGSALPQELGERGSLTFDRASSEGAASAEITLGVADPGSYALTLLSGRYVVSHRANGALCGAGAALPTVPCASQVLLGCDP